MKTCYRCSKKKPLGEFNVNNAKRDGLQQHCRECQKGLSRDYYSKNSKRMRAQIGAANRRRLIESFKIVVSHLMRNPCVDCGESDVRVLEFDHVRGTKRAHISNMVGNVGEGVLQNEISKCEVRCANCHRRKTREKHNVFLGVVAQMDRAAGSYPED